MATHAQRSDLSRAIRARARDLGFEAVGIAPLHASDHAALYRSWIGRGLHGEMAYLARDDAVAARLEPRSRWPELRTAVVVGHHYSGSGAEDAGLPVEATFGDPATGVIARYARGRDYHRVVKKKLMALLRWLEGKTGRELPTARAYVDTGPILERELGRRAGLGWFGRNTMLIDPRRGSYFFLGELLLPFQLEYDAPFTADRCGTCRACIPACPTDALLGRSDDGAPVMDATRCISYLTIENQGPIPEEIRPLMGNRVFGCDICQTCCPWNSPKLVPTTAERDYRLDWRAEDRPDVPEDLPGTESPSLAELMRMTREEWDAWTRGSAIRRAGYAGFKRNLAVAIGNWLASADEPPEAAVAALRDALEEEALVREHTAWALGRALRDRRRGRQAP
ncbi:MAG: tRNA epoxyqueuosine(34) reductase QueG [Candidatus Longimicrobiales bacterium M2_2A_002]